MPRPVLERLPGGAAAVGVAGAGDGRARPGTATRASSARRRWPRRCARSGSTWPSTAPRRTSGPSGALDDVVVPWAEVEAAGGGDGDVRVLARRLIAAAAARRPRHPGGTNHG